MQAEIREQGGRVRAFDSAGNPYRRSDRRDRAYGPGGRLLASDAGQFEYDANGRRVAWTAAGGERWEYVWAVEGQLAEVRRPDGVCVQLAYDGLGRRRRKTVVEPSESSESARTTSYVWSGHVVMHEIADAGASLLAYEDGSFTPLAVIQNGAARILVSDHAGAPTLVFDGEGRLAASLRLDIYGKLEQLGGPDQGVEFRWPGQVVDEDLGALYYNWHRYYDPVAGLYLSPDPIGLAGGLRAYGYVGDPNSWIDPLGLGKLRHSGGPRSRDLALGRYNRNGPPSGGNLTEFAQQFDAAHAETMVDPENQLRRPNATSFAEAFDQATRSTIDRGGKIRFDLTGVNVRDALAFRLTGDHFADMYPNGTTRVTEWELRRIMGNRELFDNTVFYRNGRRLSKKDLRQMGIRCGG